MKKPISSLKLKRMVMVGGSPASNAYVEIIWLSDCIIGGVLRTMSRRKRSEPLPNERDVESG